MFRGPLPEVTEGEKERAVREWLKSRGNLPLSRVCRLLPRPQASPRTSTIGRSASTGHHPSELLVHLFQIAVRLITRSARVVNVYKLTSPIFAQKRNENWLYRFSRTPEKLEYPGRKQDSDQTTLISWEANNAVTYYPS